MPSSTPALLRRLVAALFVPALLVPAAAACGEGDEQGRPLERDTSENPNGGGQPGDGSDDVDGMNDDADDDGPAGQPQTGTDDAGENDSSGQ